MREKRNGKYNFCFRPRNKDGNADSVTNFTLFNGQKHCANYNLLFDNNEKKIAFCHEIVKVGNTERYKGSIFQRCCFQICR